MIFTGYSEISPITKTEHWREGKWVEERRVLRCGTGLKSCTIAPGQSAVFSSHPGGWTEGQTKHMLGFCHPNLRDRSLGGMQFFDEATGVCLLHTN